MGNLGVDLNSEFQHRLFQVDCVCVSHLKITDLKNQKFVTFVGDMIPGAAKGPDHLCGLYPGTKSITFNLTILSSREQA